MKAIELKLPEDIYEKLESMASHEHQPVNAFAPRQLEELVCAFEDFRELERRARRGNRDQFQAAMAQVPNLPPMPADEPWPPRPAKPRIVVLGIRFEPDWPADGGGKKSKSVTAGSTSSVWNLPPGLKSGISRQMGSRTLQPPTRVLSSSSGSAASTGIKNGPNYGLTRRRGNRTCVGIHWLHLL
jgi:hypothetical protein